jgi:large subunit ribosomal protein L4
VTAELEYRSQTGAVAGRVSLDAAVFSVEPKVALMHQVVTAQLAAARAGTHNTKTRAEVAGGGAKPYRQKGTGRARQGSVRAPHYAGGGIALGPKPRSYRQHTPKKMVRQALHGALSDRAAIGRIAVVDAWSFEIPSTKDARVGLENLGVSGRALVVLTRQDEKAYKSFRNIPWVDVSLASELSAHDVLCADWLVFTRETLPGENAWTEAHAAPGAVEGEGNQTKAAPASRASSGRAQPAAQLAAEVEEEAAAAEADETVEASSAQASSAQASSAQAGSAQAGSVEAGAADAGEAGPGGETVEDGELGPEGEES